LRLDRGGVRCSVGIGDSGRLKRRWAFRVRAALLLPVAVAPFAFVLTLTFALSFAFVVSLFDLVLVLFVIVTRRRRMPTGVFFPIALLARARLGVFLPIKRL